MAKQIQTIVLNELQIGTLDALRTMSQPAIDGFVHADVAANFKGNVINALIRHGALRTFRGRHFKIVNAIVLLRPEVKHRTPKDQVQLAA